MKSNVSRLAGALALSLFASLAAAAVDAPAGAQSARVIVKFKADSGLLRKQAASAGERHAAQAQALAARVGFAMAAGRGVGENTQVVFASGMSSAALAERLAKEKDIEYAVPDRRKTRAAVPNDPLYATAGNPNTATQSGGPVAGQWYLRAPTTTLRSAVNAEAAWDVTLGSSSVVVAVLDTGVRFDHVDLKRAVNGGKLLDGYDMVGVDRDDTGTVITPTGYQQANDGNGRDADPSDPGDGITAAEANNSAGLFYQCTTLNPTTGKYIDEPSSWHGTQTSGLIGALTGNGTGIAGVGRNVKILPVRVLGKCGGWDSDIVAGMNWAAGLSVPGLPANPNPAKVLNLSLGGTGTCSALYQDAVAAITAAGVVVVASAGNGLGHAVGEPANCSGVVAVGGLRQVGTKAPYSDLGSVVTISAPAGNCVNTGTTDPCLYPILSTTNSGVYAPVSDASGGSTYTDAFNATLGTSFSAPLVSGAAALILSVRPSMTPAEVRGLLQATATAFPTSGGAAGTQNCAAPSTTDQLECYCTTSTCGAGMLNVGAALQSVLAQDKIVAGITQSPLDVPIGSAVTLTATAATASSPGNTTYAWTVTDDGGGVVGGFSSATNASVASLVPGKAGRFVVQLTVSDATNGVASTTATVYVRDPAASSGGSGGGGGGGGGALGFGWLAALALAVAALGGRRGRRGAEAP